MSNVRHLFAAIVLLFPWASPAQTLWDNWYIESDNGTPVSYYNEKAELKGDRAKIQVNKWIREGKRIRSETLGATAKNTALLEPLLYTFRTQQDGEEKIIDGTVSNNGKIFSVKSKTGIRQSQPLRAEMLPKLILTSFFPVWIHKNSKRISGVQPIEFQSILEDQVENDVKVVRGTAYEMKADAFAKETRTRKLRIEFNRIVAFWWVTPKGDAVRIEVPALGKTVTLSDRKKAEASFEP
jgi:hypothetical protein